jgi:hypothetical protein
MKHACSLRLDLVSQNDHFGWRLFHRTAGPNRSIAAVLPMPQMSAPSEMTQPLQAALRLHDAGLLREWGKTAAEALFPVVIRNDLEKYTSGDLLFMVPEEWADVPFELLYVADDFLCRRFSIGTIICTKQDFGTAARYNTGSSILIIADPAGNIPAAYEEASAVRAYAWKSGKDTHFISASDKQKIISSVENAAVVHFAGHSVYTGEKCSSGWKFGNTELFDIVAMEQLGSNGRVPWMVFSNSCNAGNSGCDKELSGIAGALLRAGVMQVIGPAAEIPDQAAHQFALCYYEYFFKGMTCGEALFTVRQRLYQENQAIIFPLLYRLYGDPCFSPQPSASLPLKETKSLEKSLIKSKRGLFIFIVLLIIAIVILSIPFGNGNIIYIPPH